MLGKFTFCEWKNLYFVGMSDSMYRLAGWQASQGLKSLLNKTDWKLKIYFPVWKVYIYSLTLNFTLWLLL